MRLPLIAPTETRDGIENKDSAMVNVLSEQSASGNICAVRPALVLNQIVSADAKGGGLVSFNSKLLSVYGANLFVQENAYAPELIEDTSVQTITVSRDMRYIFVINLAGTGVTRWDTTDWTDSTIFSGYGAISSIACSDDGRVAYAFISTGGANALTRWSEDDGEESIASISWVTSNGLICSDDGMSVAVAYKTAIAHKLEVYPYGAAVVVVYDSLAASPDLTSASADLSTLCMRKVEHPTYSVEVYKNNTLLKSIADARYGVCSRDGTTVVGWYSTANGPFIWTEEDDVQALTMSQFYSPATSYDTVLPFFLSDNGSAVFGTAEVAGGEGAYRAFARYSDSEVYDIGHESLTYNSDVLAVSSDGRTVVVVADAFPFSSSEGKDLMVWEYGKGVIKTFRLTGDQVVRSVVSPVNKERIFCVLEDYYNTGFTAVYFDLIGTRNFAALSGDFFDFAQSVT
jgi:hypothetical protein